MIYPLLLAVLFALPSPHLSQQLRNPMQYEWLAALEQCESTGSTTVKILDSNNKYSHGVVQFQMDTWLAYGKDFGATRNNIYSKELQEQVALAMLRNGGSSHWLNCSNKISKKIGPFPL